MRRQKKRVAIFGLKGLPGFGGAARANENIILQLKNDYDFIVYAVSTHTDLAGQQDGYFQIVFKGVRNRRLNILLYYIKSVAHALFKDNFDLIQLNHMSSGFIAPFLRVKYKIVATARGIIPKDDNKWNRMDKLMFHISSLFFFNFANTSISVSKPHIDIFRKITWKSIDYIPNGINVEDNKLVTRKKDKYLLFAAGRIISLKGGHVLLRALHNVKFKQKIMFIGSLDHNNDYRQEIFDLSKGLNIEFPGLIKNKVRLFEMIRESSLFVFPSFNEGMSNMLLEVASLGIPIICSDIPENMAVFDKDEVLFFKVGDKDDLAKKISFAYDNYNQMINRAIKAFEKLSNEYRWSIIASKYKETYEKLL